MTPRIFCKQGKKTPCSVPSFLLVDVLSLEDPDAWECVEAESKEGVVRDGELDIVEASSMETTVLESDISDALLATAAAVACLVV